MLRISKRDKNIVPIVKDLVLVGGGHTHALVLKKLSMTKLPGIRVTLVSDVALTPYSGMLPAYIAGHYNYYDCHIDLIKLCAQADVQWILSPVEGLHTTQKQLIIHDHAPLHYDVLSINVGSIPHRDGIEGALQNTIPIKPVPDFLNAYEKIRKASHSRIIIVGAGAGGVELALNLKFRLDGRTQITLLEQNSEIMSAHAPRVRRLLLNELKKRGIQFINNAGIKKIHSSQVEFIDGQSRDFDFCIWVTHAQAASWLKNTDLKVSESSFIVTNEFLQSVSHPNVFAVGDVASHLPHPSPKSGVFAVRQGPYLWHNLFNFLFNKPLKAYRPQKRFLSLIGTGRKTAVVSWGGLAHHSSLAWHLKDWIDRRFMKKFLNAESKIKIPLSDNNEIDKPHSESHFRCQGCAAKIGGATLRGALNSVSELSLQGPSVSHHIISLGLNDLEDVAGFKVPAGQLLVQSIDYFPTLIPDPYDFGRILVNHAMSDVIAKNAVPHSALALVVVPFAAASKMQDHLFQVMAGIQTQLNKLNATLIGGHSAEGLQLAGGVVANGIADPDRMWLKSKAQVGDAIILTKPLGIGTLFAAHMRGKARGDWVKAAVESMLQSNLRAAQTLSQFDIHACTDVTGFGLLGHLIEILQASQVGCRLNLSALPPLPGALECLKSGITSSLAPMNSQYLKFLKEPAPSHIDDPRMKLLSDPQTSGGLLICLPQKSADRALRSLNEDDSFPSHQCSAQIGIVTQASDGITLSSEF